MNGAGETPVQQAALPSEIFAANRSRGRVALTVGADRGVVRRRQVYEDGPLRVRFPNTAPGRLEAVIVNTAGGVAGGDRHDIAVTVDPGATLSVTTPAAEKVYRAIDTAADVAVRLAVRDGGRLTWLPQETILFDRAQLARRIDVDLDDGATLVMAEAVVFGRAAMGEAVEQGALTDRWRVRRGGRLMFAETLQLADAPAAQLAKPAVADGAIALATVLAVPGNPEMVERVRAQAAGFGSEVGASAWNGLAVARLCAKDSLALRRDLAAVIVAFGGVLPRLWLN